MRLTFSVTLTVACASVASAQILTQRGLVQGRGFLFPQEAANQASRMVGDILLREEVLLKPRPWVQFAAGLDLRAGSGGQGEDAWRLDFWDRTLLRPRLSVRRLSATFTRRGLTVDLGKQFIRWGKTDFVTPTDRFAPRDFLYVFENDFIAVTGARVSVLAGSETFEAVWIPRFTPSRIPLPNQRWTPAPPAPASAPVVDVGRSLAEGSQVGVRWSHVSTLFEASVSYFDGFNHLPSLSLRAKPEPPEIDAGLVYPEIRSYGIDAALPLRWVTIKAEAAYFTSPSPAADEYVLFVLQLERQSGEWAFVGGYAGEVVTVRRAALPFAPDRGLTRALIGRASYTIDSNRSVVFEGAVRQNGDGGYAKAEYSQAYGRHWRGTVAAILIRGERTDFIGQYRRNSHVAISLRYSF